MSTETGSRYSKEIEPLPEFGVVVALGKNWRLPITGDPQIHLSIESKMTTLAGGELIVNGIAGKLLISSGKTAGVDNDGNEYPGEAEEMFNFLRRHFSEDEVPSSSVILETESFDTAGNAEEVKDILDSNDFGNVAIVTVTPHTRRASKLFKNYGIEIAKVFGSQGILKGRSERYNRLLKEYYLSGKFVKELLVESIGTALVYTIDPRGDKIVRKMSQKTRSREE